MKKKIEIQIDQKTYLKTLDVNDVSTNYVNWLNDYETMKYTEQSKIKHTYKSVKKFVLQKYDSKDDLLFGIFVDGLHIGNIKLGPINFDHLSADISFFIGNKNFLGMGITSKCLKELINFAIDKLNIKKINAGYYENNIASEKVLKKCGFVFEGRRLSNIIFEGERINTIMVGYIP